MQLDIVKPKVTDLEVLFLRVRITPCEGCAEVFTAKSILIGDRGPFVWKASTKVFVDNIRIDLPGETFHAPFVDGSIRLYIDDSISVTITWHARD